MIRDNGFLSTSINSSSAFYKDIEFIIKVPKGAPGAYVGNISYLPNEMEILFDKGREMIITDVKRKGNRLQITTEMRR